jgi:hypothetical protein
MSTAAVSGQPAAASAQVASAPPIDLKVSEAAEKADFVWEGFVAAKAPDGRWIPVLKAVRITEDVDDDGETEYSHFGDLGASYERVKLDNSAMPADDSGCDAVTYRPKRDFDYTPYGLEKIGKIWVNPNHPLAVADAIRIRDKRTCVIL